MAQTYAQIQKQIEELQKQAEALRSDEVKGVIERIREAIAAYDLTADQLGFGSAKVSTSKSLFAPTVKTAGTTKSKTGKAMFSDKAGNIWVGRGPRPLWLREALQAGHDLNEYRIGNRTRAKKNLVPLTSSDAASAPSTSASPAPAPAAKKAVPARKSPKVTYANGDGKTWSGMGPKPGWLKDAIEAGKSQADFAQ